MLKQAAKAQGFIEANYNGDERQLSPRFKYKDLRRHHRYGNIFLLPPTYSSTIRAILEGKTGVRAETTECFDRVDEPTMPESHLRYTADEWQMKLEDDVERRRLQPWGVDDLMMESLAMTFRSKVVYDLHLALSRT